MAETQKEKIMRVLNLSAEEAEEVMAYDKAVDRAGAKTQLEHDLDPEKAKEAQKFVKAGTKAPTVYKFDTAKRQRKENPTKAELIAFLEKTLAEYADCQNLVITNKERQIAFSIADNDFELTLVQKRKKK